MEVIVGRLKSSIKTDNKGILDALYNKYGFRVEGCQYTNAYKRKFWDGKKRYVSKDGEFKSGLLSRILDDLSKINLKELIVKYDYDTSEVVELKKIDAIDYFDYQEEAIKDCLSLKRCIVKSPVGSGKTIMMAGLIKSLAPKKMVILFKEVGILSQTYEFFKSHGIKNLGINFGGAFEHGDVMLSTVQSIEKIIDTHLTKAECLIIDEAHQFCKGETTIAAIESFPNASYRFAFTATTPPDIHGQMVLEGAFGKIVETKTINDLIADGVLTEPKIQIIHYKPSEKVDNDIEYSNVYDEHVVNSEERNNLIIKCVEFIRGQNPKAKILILCKNLDHVKALNSGIPNSLTVEGKNTLQERYATVKKFIEAKTSSALIGTNVLQTGININEVTHMINARGLEGEIPTIQGLGRGVRKSKDKNVLYFYDFYDDCPYLKDHSKSRIKHYENLKFNISYVKI